MQLLADVGLEDGEWEGLGLVPGTCERLPRRREGPAHRLEHRRVPAREPAVRRHPRVDARSTSCTATASCRATPASIIGSTEYGVRFAAAVQIGERLRRAVPPREVLGRMGLQLLANFGRIVEGAQRMIVFPAIDILGGKAVRLAQGDYDARDRLQRGPGRPGARLRRRRAPSGSTSSTSTARATACPATSTSSSASSREVGVPRQVGGGIRTLETMRAPRRGRRRAHGARHEARRPTPSFVREAVRRVRRRGRRGHRRARRQGRGRGLARGHATTACSSSSRELRDLGVRHLVYTDIAATACRPASTTAPTGRSPSQAGFPVIASGGVSTLDDIRELAALGPARSRASSSAARSTRARSRSRGHRRRARGGVSAAC